MSTNQKGAIAEAQITAAAIELGIPVLKPVIEGLRCDLVFELGTRLVRAQCKWANRVGDVVVIRNRTCQYTPNGYVRTTYTAAEVDGIAAWCAETRDCYFVPIADIEGHAHLSLRLAPARNN